MAELTKELAEETKLEKEVQERIQKIRKDAGDFFNDDDDLDDEHERLTLKLRTIKDMYQPEVRPLKDWGRDLDQKLLTETEAFDAVHKQNLELEKSFLPKPAKGAKPVTTAPPRIYLEHSQKLASSLKAGFDKDLQLQEKKN